MTFVAPKAYRGHLFPGSNIQRADLNRDVRSSPLFCVRVYVFVHFPGYPTSEIHTLALF